MANRFYSFIRESSPIAPRALINPPFRGGSCPKSVTHVSPLMCHPCPPTIPDQTQQASPFLFPPDVALRFRTKKSRKRTHLSAVSRASPGSNRVFLSFSLASILAHCLIFYLNPPKNTPSIAVGLDGDEFGIVGASHTIK